MSDDMPADTVRAAHPDFAATDGHGITYTASLDHTIWFHRPLRADEWHLYDFSCHAFTGARGLGIGHVFSTDGTHVATVAQEVLMRDARQTAARLTACLRSTAWPTRSTPSPASPARSRCAPARSPPSTSTSTASRHSRRCSPRSPRRWRR